MRTLDRRTSWAPCRNSHKASAQSFKEPPLPSTPCFTSGWHHYNNHTLEPYHELGLDSQRVNKIASKLHIHSVNYAAKLVHNRRAHSSTTVINSHQERVPGQACNPPDPHLFSCSLVEEFYSMRYQSGSFSSISVGSVFHCLLPAYFFHFYSSKHHELPFLLISARVPAVEVAQILPQ